MSRISGAAGVVCSEVAPAIAARLSRDGVTVRRVGTRVRYPADRATGYREGDLRGAVSVTVLP